MATRSRTTTAQLPSSSLGVLAPENMVTSSDDDVLPSLNLADDGAASNDQQQQVAVMSGGEGEQIPASWILNSSLMMPSTDIEHGEPSCLFEPLNYCRPGKLYFGFCEHHVQYMFNIARDKVGMLIRTADDKMKHIQYTRKFIKFPMKFQSSLLRIMPIPELCRDIDEYERVLRLDLFAYLLSQRATNPQAIDIEIAVHKAYLIRIMRLFTPNNNTLHRNDDSVISYSVNNWLRYCANELKRVAYDGKLVFLSSSGDRPEMRYLSLNRCSILTQMIALSYDTAYAQSVNLNYRWLSSPAAVIVYDNSLVLDCTKASHGTISNAAVQTLGDPATLSYFRLDKNMNIDISADKFSPAREICFRSEVNKSDLIGIVPETPEQRRLLNR